MTVDEIDQALLKIASHNTRSSPQVRSLASNVKAPDTIELLGSIYRRLQGREAKWLTRLILKDYGPVKFPDRLDVASNMQFLPTCIQINAEISISDAFPTLRDGQRETRGFVPRNACINQLPATPMPTIVDRGDDPSAKKQVNQLPTPPTTTPKPLPSAALPSPPRVRIRCQTREPLAILDINNRPTPQYPGTKAYEPTSSMSLISTSTITHQASSPPICVTSLRTRTRSSQRSPAMPSASLPISGTGTCRLTSHLCPLINCIFLLSPCISTIPYITEDLLSWHGSRTVISLSHLSDPSFPRRCSNTGRKYRKIALVEPNRTGPTTDFLKRIQKLDLRRSGREKGKKQWVEVYDWRILECVAKVDRGKELGYNYWRRCWIGAV